MKNLVVVAMACVAMFVQARTCDVCCGTGKVRKNVYTYNGSYRAERSCEKCGGTGEVNGAVTSKRGTVKSRVMNPRKEIEQRRLYIRTLLGEQNISCSTRTELANTINSLVEGCVKEDEEMMSLVKGAGFDIEFHRNWASTFVKVDNIWTKSEVLIVKTPVASEYFASSKIKKMCEETCKGLSMTNDCLNRVMMNVIGNYKKHCEVHKWDDDCCPRFGGDYYTFDIKAKYAANKMKAYELMEKGMLSCTCKKHLELEKGRIEYIMSKISETKRQMDEIKAKCEPIISKLEEFENNRQDIQKKIETCEEAWKQLDIIKTLK